MRKTVENPFLQGELRDLVPTDELWWPPVDAPPDVIDEMAGEEEVVVIFEGYFGPHPPEGWTIGLARAMVNLGRRKCYEEWKSRSSDTDI